MRKSNVFLEWTILYSKPISKETQWNKFICSRLHFYRVFPSIFYILPHILLLCLFVQLHLLLFAFYLWFNYFIQHVCAFHLLQYRCFPRTLQRLLQHCLHQNIIIHNNNFTGITSSYFSKTFISFKTFIFSTSFFSPSNTRSSFCQYFSPTSFQFPDFHFCMFEFQKAKKWQHNQWCKCNTRNLANITNVSAISISFSTDITANTRHCWCSIRTSLLT